jgi:hypothetical protein
LPPGNFPFLVGANSSAADAAASVEFEILPHFWQRWWFLAFVVVAIRERSDSMGDLASRIRRFADEVLGGSDNSCNVVAMEDDRDRRLTVDARHQ